LAEAVVEQQQALAVVEVLRIEHVLVQVVAGLQHELVAVLVLNIELLELAE